jgi:hypothetical protein
MSARKAIFIGPIEVDIDRSCRRNAALCGKWYVERPKVFQGQNPSKDKMSRIYFVAEWVIGPAHMKPRTCLKDIVSTRARSSRHKRADAEKIGRFTSLNFSLTGVFFSPQ